MNNYGKRLSQSLFYWIIYSYLLPLFRIYQCFQLSQSLFYWIIYSYSIAERRLAIFPGSLNPYFIGLSILIGYRKLEKAELTLSQSLFYWIIYSYHLLWYIIGKWKGLNPYFIGLSILIGITFKGEVIKSVVSILILLDYLFL